MRKNTEDNLAEGEGGSKVYEDRPINLTSCGKLLIAGVTIG